MIVLIPLGGTGVRFKQNGYKKPKALINVFGKPILYYLLDHLSLERVDMVCIPYNDEYHAHGLEEELVRAYPDTTFRFVHLKKNTGGAAETINIGLRSLGETDRPVLCLDGDNFYTTDVIRAWDGKDRVMTFKDSSESPIYSYVALDKDGSTVLDIVEKQKISDHACTGAYGFSSSRRLLTYTQKVLDGGITQKGEYYTSVVIREMIRDGTPFDTAVVDGEHYHCLGTPLQLKFFYNNYPKVSCIDGSLNIRHKRVCFDLDNTLVTYPRVPNDYTSVEPIPHTIRFLRYLKSFGHTIIIYTARRMKTHKGNCGRSLADIGKITFDTLERFDIPFDEIYFGKPHADVYIDDLAINRHEDLEKELGYYMEHISPRQHNRLDADTMEVYTKRSDDLSGEIYYYKNIPVEIKDLFPVLIDHDTEHKWYKVEKIKGLTITNLYINGLLTTAMLRHVMSTILRLQGADAGREPAINIYDNYAKKLRERYRSYDYSRFPGSDRLFDELHEQLTAYEAEDRGKRVVIHGDLVMTNILVNSLGKLKLIDMRGKAGNVSSICGDYLYDWAKLYQSLVGYDKILMRKKMDPVYEQEMIKTFREYFVELFSETEFENTRLITKSLLFTLIPIHDNELCENFYELIGQV